MYPPSSPFSTGENIKLSLLACWMRGMLGLGRGTELKNQETVGEGFPATMQSRTTRKPSLAITGRTAG